MLVIRLNRFGKKNQAAFRVVLQEKTKAPGRRHIEMLGSYNPHSKVILLNKERILYWIGQGATPSDRVHNMLVKEKVIEGKLVPKKMPRPVKPITAEAEAGKKEEPKPQTEAPGTETSKSEVEAPAAVPSAEGVAVPVPAEIPKEEVKA